MPGMTLRRIRAALLCLGLLLFATLLFGAPAWAQLSGVDSASGPPTNPPFAPLDTLSSTATPAPACGLSWRIVAAPNPDPVHNRFNAVAAVAANDIWAVGGIGGSNLTSSTLTEHWDGHAWVQVPS